MSDHLKSKPTDFFRYSVKFGTKNELMSDRNDDNRVDYALKILSIFDFNLDFL